MMREMISRYLERKQLTWTFQTLRSEESRLRTLERLLPDTVPTLSPSSIWEALKGRGSYTRNLDWIRLEDLFSTEVPELSHAMKKWKKENKHVFKNAYKRKTPKISYEEARAAIEKIDEPNLRAQARCLLYAGLRAHELSKLNADGSVIGKGGKLRQVILPEGLQMSPGSYSILYKALKKVGLKPHDLRKIRATDLLRKGMDLRTLQQIFGWSSLRSAESYLAPLSIEKARSFFHD